MEDKRDAVELNRSALEFFDRAQVAVLEKFAKGLQDVTTDLASQGSLIAPVRYGFLRASITDYPVTMFLQGGRIVMKGLVAARQPYAEIQHERVDFNHPKGGQDHYLTRPLKERKRMYRDWLGEDLIAAIKKAKSVL